MPSYKHGHAEDLSLQTKALLARAWGHWKKRERERPELWFCKEGYSSEAERVPTLRSIPTHPH